MKGKAIKNIITTVGLPVLFGALIFTLWQTKVCTHCSKRMR